MAAASRASETSNVHDRLGKSLWGFLWQVVAHTTIDGAMRVFAREFLGVRGRFRMWRTIGITFERDSGHGDVGRSSQAPFEVLVPRFARGAEAPAIIVDDDVDMIGIIESRRCALERLLIEVPFWGGKLPDEPGKVASVFVVARPAPVRSKVVLVPPLVLGLGRQWDLPGFLATDEIAADGDEAPAAFWPESRNDVRAAPAPIVTAQDRLLNLERIHQVNDVVSQRGLFPVANRCAGKKSRRAIAARVRNDDSVAGRSQQGSHIDKAVNVVRPAMQ